MEKLKKFLIVIVLLVFITQAQAVISNVNIVPEIPAATDIITIITAGAQGWGGKIDNVDFVMNGTSLQLDIFITLGITPAGWIWSHSEIIGTLPKGIYNLQVREYGWHGINQEYVLGSTYPLTFEVIPEPGTLILLSLGLPFLSTTLRKKK